MFRGITAVNLDGKGRMAIPIRYRAILEQHAKNQLVVTIDTDDRCLLLYPLPEWESIEAKVESLSSFNRNSRRIQRLLIGHATEVEIDTNGRILLPRLLLDHAHIEKQVMLVGQGKKFEIWSDVMWQQGRNEWIIGALIGKDEAPEDLLSLSL